MFGSCYWKWFLKTFFENLESTNYLANMAKLESNNNKILGQKNESNKDENNLFKQGARVHDNH